MGLNFFNAELKCSNCGKVLNSGDEIVVHITLPSQKKMPVGILDKETLSECLLNTLSKIPTGIFF